MAVVVIKNKKNLNLPTLYRAESPIERRPEFNGRITKLEGTNLHVHATSLTMYYNRV